MFFNNEANEIFGSMILGPADDPAKSIFEEAGEVGAITDFAARQTRSQAMSCALAWLEGGDFSFETLADICAVVADLDEDEEFDADEEAYYNELLVEVGNALVSLGADSGNVQTFLDDEDSETGAKIGEFISEKLTAVEAEDDELISNYATTDSPIMEGVVKVVRDGKVVLKKKRIGRPKKMTAAQKIGLKKARRKAFTGAAKLARRKAMKVRKKRGM
jgi:hypothetical protein